MTGREVGWFHFFSEHLILYYNNSVVSETCHSCMPGTLLWTVAFSIFLSELTSLPQTELPGGLGKWVLSRRKSCRKEGAEEQHLTISAWPSGTLKAHFPLRTIAPDFPDSINWSFQLISHTERPAANMADSSGASAPRVICALMECDIRNRIWAAWHLLHFQLNHSQTALTDTLQQQQPQGTATSLLWADPWHISASPMETAAGNCLVARRNGSGHKHECTVRGCNSSWETQKKPRKKPHIPNALWPCLLIARSETQSSVSQSLSTLSGKDVACKYKSLLAQEKSHCRRQHIPWIQALCIWKARGSTSSVNPHTNSAALHFYLDLPACIINKSYSWASNNEPWV